MYTCKSTPNVVGQSGEAQAYTPDSTRPSGLSKQAIWPGRMRSACYLKFVVVVVEIITQVDV